MQHDDGAFDDGRRRAAPFSGPHLPTSKHNETGNELVYQVNNVASVQVRDHATLGRKEHTTLGRQAFLELLDEGISLLHTLRSIKTAPVTGGFAPEMKNGTLGMTVGRTRDECEVKCVLPGGPAARSRQIARGDVILSIDGKRVDASTPADLTALLLYPNTPGSKVKIQVRNQKNQVNTVALERMPRERIEHRKALFDIFLQLLEDAEAMNGEAWSRASSDSPAVKPWGPRGKPLPLVPVATPRTLQNSESGSQASSSPRSQASSSPRKQLIDSPSSSRSVGVPPLLVPFQGGEGCGSSPSTRERVVISEIEVLRPRTPSPSPECIEMNGTLGHILKPVQVQSEAAQTPQNPTPDFVSVVQRGIDTWMQMVDKEDELAEANQQDLQQGVDGLETVFVKLQNMTTKSSEWGEDHAFAEFDACLEAQQHELAELSSQIRDKSDKILQLEAFKAAYEAQIATVAAPERKAEAESSKKLAGAEWKQHGNVDDACRDRDQEEDSLQRLIAWLPHSTEPSDTHNYAHSCALQVITRPVAPSKALQEKLYNKEGENKSGCFSARDRAIELICLAKCYIGKELLCNHKSIGHIAKGNEIHNETTIGIMFDDKTGIIANVLVGGPAYNSKKVFKGDTIMSIDGIGAASGHLLEMLKGIDKPESVVTIGLKRTSGTVEEIKLRRMANTKLADKRVMFEIFTKIASRAKSAKDQELEKYVQDALELWTAEMSEQCDHDELVADNIHDMQKKCEIWFEELLQILESDSDCGNAAELWKLRDRLLELDEMVKAANYARQNMLKELDKHKLTAEKEAQRRLEVCRRMVKRMLDAHLAAAFNSLAQTVAGRIHRRAVVNRVLCRLRHGQLAAAFISFAQTVADRIQRRDVVHRVVCRLRHGLLSAKFDNWLEYVDLCRVELQREGIELAHKKMSGELDDARQNMLKELDKHKLTAEKEAQRRLEVCRRMVKRMLDAHLAAAFNSLAQTVAGRIHRRAVVNRVLCRLRHGQLAAAFISFAQTVADRIQRRDVVHRVVCRLRHGLLSAKFDNWLEYVDLCRAELQREGIELAHKKMSGELDDARQNMLKELDKHKLTAEKEAQRRLEVCRRMVKRMLDAHLAAAFNSLAQTVAGRIHRRAVVNRVLCRLRHGQLAAAFISFAQTVADRIQRRDVVHRVVCRLRHGLLSAKFDNWLEYVDLCRVELQREGIELAHKKMSGELDDARQNMLKELDKHKLTAEKEAQRRLEVCRRMVKRMLDAHLAAAFNSLAQTVAGRIHRRAVVNRVLCRLRHGQLAAAFISFAQTVADRIQRRDVVHRVVCRLRHGLLSAKFDNWLEYVDLCRAELQREGIELAHKKMSGELDDARQNMLKELDKHKLTAEKEAQRRLEVCRRMVKRMLDAHLAAAFNSLAQTVAGRIHRRAVVNRVLCRLRHGQLAAAFISFAQTVADRIQRRDVVHRVVCRLRHGLLSAKFDNWLEYVDLCRVELQREGIELAHKKMSGELDDARQNMLKELDKHKLTAEKEAQRRLEVCRRMVKRMLDAHLAAAFNSLAQTVAGRIHRRAVVNRVLCRLRHGQLAAAFISFAQTVADRIQRRDVVHRVVCRLRHGLLSAKFDNWLEYVDLCRVELQREGIELAHKKMSGELDDARQNMLKELDKYKLRAEKEAQRRLEVCRRMVKRMLDAHLAAAFNSLAQTVADRIHRRAVVNRVLCRLRHGLLTAKFEIWVEYVDACRAPLWALPLTLTLDMDLDSITDRESFIGDVVEDVAAAAKIDVRFVKVVGMRAGSVIVDLQIPPEAGDLDQIEEHLVGQVKHMDSALRSGKITAKAIKLESTSKMANHKQLEESDISITKVQTQRTQRSANLFGQKSALKSNRRRTANEFEDPIPICVIDTKQGCEEDFFGLTQQDIKTPSHGLAYLSGGLTVCILLLTAFRWLEGSGNMQSMSILLPFFVALFIFSLGSRGGEKKVQRWSTPEPEEKRVSDVKKFQKALRSAPVPGSTPKMVEVEWVRHIYIVVIFAQCWMLWYTCLQHSARHLLPGIQ